MEQKDSLFRRGGVNFLLPFIVITSCFALWGFANDVTTPMVKAFSKIFRMSATEGSMVPVAFNLGYFCMAFPAAMFIQRFSYKAGVMVGLGLYAAGALLFIPASMTGMFIPFLLAYFVLTCGLSFLETSCNPFIYSMGSDETATRRLNLAQAFNPLGCLAGMYVALRVVQANMNPLSSTERLSLSEAEFELVKQHDLEVLIQPYVYIGLVVLALLVTLAMTKIPKVCDKPSTKPIMQSLRELVHTAGYREGVIAQFFYIGAQITCWTFILHYGARVFMNEGMAESEAEQLAQIYNIGALCLFSCSRFICTWFLGFVKASKLLMVLAILGVTFAAGSIFIDGRVGLYSLVAMSGCMSLMFPTIYGIALTGVGDNVKVAAAGLIMAILGGSFFPPIQASIIDSGVTIGNIATVNLSFIIPLICFGVVAVYGYRSTRRMV